jgi:N-acetylmuramic acid 6-phosphate etherase
MDMNSADEFLATGQRFHLGVLETEKSHPATRELSSLALNDLPRAISTMANVDVAALEKMKSKIDSILHLRAAIERVFRAGRKVYLCGCGATGRLSLSLEYLWRESARGPADAVVGLMAGGDVALVHSLEGFEDFPEYGARHLKELGFQNGDLLISSTEGGETPYVIGATEWAAEVSTEKPFFLYCNPDSVLRENVERSRKVIDNPKIEKINLTVGPMALAGSTRMQASTVLQLVVGVALLSSANSEQILAFLNELQQYMQNEASPFLPGFTEREAREYQENNYVLYWVKNYPITVFTDTTERAPTFSLTPFSHPSAERLLKLKPSLCYIGMPDAKDGPVAWKQLLLRSPRPLNWLDVDSRTGSDYLQAFDFSQKAREFRSWLTKEAPHSDFEISRKDNRLLWSFQNHERALTLPEKDQVTSELRPLFEHLLLKMLLNIHSTLLMGRLGRYKRNLMTWVYPTNGKLIDRATRYARTLLLEDGIEVSYEKVVRKLFELKGQVTANESIVLATYEALKAIERTQ